VESRHPDYFQGYQREKLQIMLDTLRTKKRSFPYRAGFDDAVVYADGHVAVCEQVAPFGHLAQWGWDLARAWNSTQAWEHRALTNRCACINGCNISTHLDLKQQQVQTAGRRPSNQGQVDAR
jgi:hypothetical protein